METSFSLILDIIVSLLLVATIIFAIRLNKRLGNLRREKKDLEAFATSFNTAVTRAESSLSFLKNTTDGLEEQVAKAQAMRDDLVFLMERGATTADRLEDVIRSSRKDKDKDKDKVKEKPAASPLVSTTVSRANFGTGTSPDVNPENERELKSEAERELLRALQSAR